MGSSTKKFPIPELTEDVTAEWLSSVLTLEIKENSISIQGNVGAGVGMLANVVAAQFEDKNSKKHNCVVKLLPLKNTREHDYITSEKMDRAEILFYRILAPALIQEIPSLEPYICPALYGDFIEEDKEKNIEGNSILVMRDLKKDGYRNKPWISDEKLSKEEVDLAIDFFAKFHTAAALLELRKKKKLNEVYDFFPEWYYPNTNIEKEVAAHTWFIAGFDHAINMVTNYITNINPSDKAEGLELISKMLEPLAPHARSINNLVLERAQKYPGLIHGDMWQNNILVNSDATKPSIKIIDWQLVGYTDSVIDLGFFLLTNAAPNLNISEIEKIAKSYYDRQEQLFSEQIKEKCLDVGNMKPRRSWEEFWQSLKTYGFTIFFILNVAGADLVNMNPEMIGKVYAVFRFLHFDAGMTDFLLEAVTNK